MKDYFKRYFCTAGKRTAYICLSHSDVVTEQEYFPKRLQLK